MRLKNNKETPTALLPFTWRSLFHWVPTPRRATTPQAPAREAGDTPTPVTRPDPVTLMHTRH